MYPQEKLTPQEIANITQNITSSDMTYTSSTLEMTQLSIAGEQQVLGIRYNVSFDTKHTRYCSHLANQIELTERHIHSHWYW